MNKNRRGSIELSFGMIFSIILIIVFISVAFYAITKFLDFQNIIKIEKFGDDLQKDIDDLWKSDQGSYEKEYSLPLKIQSVCFISSKEGFENMIFVSKSIIEEKLINHIDIQATTVGSSDRACFENKNGKVSMILKKDFGENFVTIK